jgi:hypothetical protein
MHLLHHIPDGLSKFGPVYGTWMWQYERFNSWICRRVLNRQHPEATVLETYRVYCCLLYFYFMGACPGHYGSVHVHVGVFITTCTYVHVYSHT